ncbi:carbon-nitrogen hydrolase family protein [Corallococcus praedator]|uniref:Carbon-nitrogen hydrolase family protein n=1 Tax=Corallococcus praedator TaxID=2316724 RepID=A0ABX9Q7I6_9BACT|nr:MULTISPECIES: carbon-nitrogen hydrolase family protein [Corallococcus]RKH20583.1 carbon-nitrogen hydrolase family protein [Corallococcus sp. CA031C]RKH92727.1 carbon-nitrogen hydrolase family protein [Corallococcus praedator]
MPPPDAIELFAVQPRVTLDDYASVATFAAHHRALAARVDALRARDASGRPLHPALAVWPEMVGAALGLVGHLSRVRRCKTTNGAMTRVALAEGWALFRTWRAFRPPSMEECLYATVAPRVHRAMFETFSGIARDYGLWVVAGSALLPSNRLGIDTPEYEPAGARTYNTSYTFAPDGHCVGVTRKVNLVPTQEDVLNLSPGRPEDLPVVDTPFGRLGTLVCYDGFREPHTSGEPWFVPCAQYLDALGVDVLAQPSANAWSWDAPWAFNAPGESQLRREQWFNEGLFTQLRTLKRVRYAVNPQLTGGFFENTFEAPSLILERRGPDDVHVLAQSEDPRGEDVLHVTVPR